MDSQQQRADTKPTNIVALTSVFPYLPEMIESFDVPPDAVAKWVCLAFIFCPSEWHDELELNLY